jgi:hypothetical protein
MHSIRTITVLLAGLVCAGTAHGNSPTVISPTNAADALVYQFFPNANFFGPPFGPPPGNFNSILTSGKRAGHDTESFLRFSLAGVTMAPFQTATLRLWVTNNAPVSPSAPTFGDEPSPTLPVSTSAYPLLASYLPNTINWNNRPARGPALDTEIISGIDRWVEFDVSALVLAQVNDPANNPHFGFAIVQDAPVRNLTDTASVYAVYHSSRNTNRPQLVISPIPEPAALAGTLPALLLLRRTRR